MKLVSVSHNMQRPNGLSELEILRQVTGGFAAFGNAVRVSAISDAQKSKVLAELAEASNRMMDATNAYLFALVRPIGHERGRHQGAAAEDCRLRSGPGAGFGRVQGFSLVTDPSSPRHRSVEPVRHVVFSRWPRRVG